MGEELTKPNHPGKTLQRTLEHRLMSQKDAALRLGMTEKQISMIVQGKAPITPTTANLLEFLLGVSASFWNNLQKNYDEKIARMNFDMNTENQLRLVEQFTCYDELAKFKYVEKTNDVREKFNNLLEFFSVTSLDMAVQIHGNQFRKSDKPNENIYSLAAWLRIGDVVAQKTETNEFNADLLISSLNEMRSLTRKNPSEYSQLLKDLCAKCGIVLVYTPYFKNTNVNGASRWISPTKALIQLSIRFKANDILWFTLFHEIGHLLKHGKKEEFVEFSGNKNQEVKEQEADIFASEALIPSASYRKFVEAGEFTHQSIVGFANYLNVGSDIVAGRLAHEKLIDWKSKNQFTLKIELA